MKNLAFSLFITGLIQALNLAASILTARYLLPAGRGELASVMLWPVLVAVVGFFSFDQGVLYYAAIRRDSAPALLTMSTITGIGLSAIAAGIGYFVLPLILTSTKSDVLSYVQFYLLFIPCNYTAMIHLGWLSGMGRFGQVNLLRFAPSALVVGSLLACIALGRVSVQAFLVANLSAQFGVAVYGLYLSRDGWSGAFRIGAFRIGAVWSALRYGGAVHIGSLLGLAASRVDQAIIALYLAPDRLGFYVVAMNVASTAALGAATAQMLAFPKIAAQPTAAGRALMLRRYSLVAMLLTVLASALVYALGRWLLVTLFGQAFERSAVLVDILLLGTIPAAMSGILLAAYRAYGRAGTAAKVSLVSFLSASIALALLVSRYGLIGAAWAYVFSQLSTLLFVLFSFERVTGITLGELTRIKADDFTPVLKRWTSLWGRSDHQARG